MRKKLLLLLWSSIPYLGFAQHYYAESGTVTGGGIVFKVRNRHGLYYEIENTNNTLTDRQAELLDGTLAGFWDYSAGEIDVESFRKAFTETFSYEEAARMRDAKDAIWVVLIKNNRGEVLEVLFSARISPQTTAITPEKFALYERNLKKYVRWKEVTEDEKKLKFMHETRKLILPYLVPYRIRDPNLMPLPDSIELK